MLVCIEGQGISGLSEKPFQILVVLYSLVENLILHLTNDFLSSYFSHQKIYQNLLRELCSILMVDL